jgi:hypothetical protein
MASVPARAAPGRISPSETLAGRICFLPKFEAVSPEDKVAGLDQAGYNHPVVILSDVVSVRGMVRAFIVSLSVPHRSCYLSCPPLHDKDMVKRHH